MSELHLEKIEGFRYTLDGGPELESKFHEINRLVVEDILKVIPADQIDALVLAGGYGRGEGGVYVVEGEERPYNDLDYYLFIKGNKRSNEEQYGAAIKAIEAERSPLAQCDVEFKIDSLAELEASHVTMFSYDLVARSAIVIGDPELFKNCDKHLEPKSIPPSEATRLLFNRCSGLIFSRQRLEQESINQQDLEFIQRNLAKIELAMGDAILTLQGAYHWGCRQRNETLHKLAPEGEIRDWQALIEAHDKGLGFKLRPTHQRESIETLKQKLQALSNAAQDVWLWVETLRLNQDFRTPTDYLLASTSLCPEQPAWRNLLVNLRRYGFASLAGKDRFRYPREQLFRAMTLLLWHGPTWSDQASRFELSSLLRTKSSSRDELIGAYENLWHMYG